MGYLYKFVALQFYGELAICTGGGTALGFGNNDSSARNGRLYRFVVHFATDGLCKGRAAPAAAQYQPCKTIAFSHNCYFIFWSGCLITRNRSDNLNASFYIGL